MHDYFPNSMVRYNLLKYITHFFFSSDTFIINAIFETENNNNNL